MRCCSTSGVSAAAAFSSVTLRSRELRCVSSPDPVLGEGGAGTLEMHGGAERLVLAVGARRVPGRWELSAACWWCWRARDGVFQVGGSSLWWSGGWWRPAVGGSRSAIPFPSGGGGRGVGAFRVGGHCGDVGDSLRLFFCVVFFVVFFLLFLFFVFFIFFYLLKVREMI